MDTTPCSFYLLVLGLLNLGPGWNADYGQALVRAEAAQKPLAVFIGSGANGWKAVSAEGELGLEVCRLLAEHYVCVYVDASQPAQQALVQSFEAGGSPLVVLSSRNRAYQAYRHSGPVTRAGLAEALQRHATDDFLEPTALRPAPYPPAEQPITLASCRT
jgi:hypothetical protein